jgi:hypothetical protein
MSGDRGPTWRRLAQQGASDRTPNLKPRLAGAFFFLAFAGSKTPRGGLAGAPHRSMRRLSTGFAADGEPGVREQVELVDPDPGFPLHPGKSALVHVS